MVTLPPGAWWPGTTPARPVCRSEIPGLLEQLRQAATADERDATDRLAEPWEPAVEVLDGHLIWPGRGMDGPERREQLGTVKDEASARVVLGVLLPHSGPCPWTPERAMPFVAVVPIIASGQAQKAPPVTASADCFLRPPEQAVLPLRVVVAP